MSNAFRSLAICILLWSGCFPPVLFQDVPGQPPPHKATEEARALLKRAQEELKEKPGSAYWHSQAAAAHAILGDLSFARTELQRAVELEAGNPVYYLGLATVCKELGDRPGEMKAIKKGISIDSNNPLAHFALGDALERSGDLDGAIREFNLSMKLLPHAIIQEKSQVYYDMKRNAYVVDGIREEAEKRVRQLKQKGGKAPSLKP